MALKLLQDSEICISVRFIDFCQNSAKINLNHLAFTYFATYFIDKFLKKTTLILFSVILKVYSVLKSDILHFFSL